MKTEKEKITDHAWNKGYFQNSYRRRLIQNYSLEADLNKIASEDINRFNGYEAESLNDVEIRLYSNNRIATLYKKKHKNPALSFIKEDEGFYNKFDSFYIFKHKKTGTWHTW